MPEFFLSPYNIYTIGIFLCSASIVGGILTAVVISFSRYRMNKKLDEEYGKRRL